MEESEGREEKDDEEEQQEEESEEGADGPRPRRLRAGDVERQGATDRIEVLSREMRSMSIAQEDKEDEEGEPELDSSSFASVTPNPNLMNPMVKQLHYCARPVKYRVVDPRGLALRSSPDIRARLDRKVPRRRGVTWYTQDTIVEGGEPVNGWVRVHGNGHWLPLYLHGSAQLLEVSPDAEEMPPIPNKPKVPTTAEASAVILKEQQQEQDFPVGRKDGRSSREISSPRHRTPSKSEKSVDRGGEGTTLPGSGPGWLQRVRNSAIARWRSRFGFGIGGEESPPPRTVWVTRVPFGMSIRRGGLDVLSVQPGSAAHAAGVKRGDKLVAVAGELISTSSWREKFLGQTPPFTILMEPICESRRRSVILRSVSPGMQRSHTRGRHAKVKTTRTNSRKTAFTSPFLSGFAQTERLSYAHRPLGYRTAPLPSPSPEQSEYVVVLPPTTQRKSWDERRKKKDKEEDEEPQTLNDDAVSLKVKTAIAQLSNSLERAPDPSMEYEDPPGLKVTLLPHQRQALAWMCWRESEFPAGGVLADEMGLGKTMMMVSLIVQNLRRNPSLIGKLSDREAQIQELEKRLMQFYLVYNKTMAGNPERIHIAAKHYLGREPQLNKRLASQYNGADLLAVKGPTLVICPAILIHQWQEEMNTRCSRNLIDSYVYYGAQRTKDARQLSRRDVVLTTYETLVRDVMGPFPVSSNVNLSTDTGHSNAVLLDSSFFPKEAGHPISPLLQINWDRLVLDEGHMIKNPSSRRSKAIQALQARARWAVTGTPLQNEMNELYSLMKFLQYSPFNISQVWDGCIQNSTMRASTLLKGIMLRRTKTMTGADGLPLVKLPKRSFTVHNLSLTRVEQAIHDTLGNRSKALFKEYIRQRKVRKESGSNEPIDVSYANFLCALLRMRQACCHPYLLREHLDPGSVAVALAGLSLGSQGVPTTQHDKKDIKFGPQSNVSFVPGEIASDSVKEAEILALVEASKQTNSRVLADSTWVSTKIRYTLSLLQDIQTNRPGDKVVIVSQWTSLLKVLEIHLQREGRRYAVIDGSVPQSHRKDIISDFNKNSAGPELMLLSMGAGGVGLNLIGGNHLILLDIHWNPAMEAQVCDRVYRVGQQKPVFVHKLLCKGTVEDRVQSLQNRKRKLFDAVVLTKKYDTAQEHGGGSGDGNKVNSSPTRLTLDELETLFS